MSQEKTHYSPASGHSYFPATYEAPKAATATAPTSRIGSPSLAPMDAEPSQSQPQATTAPEDTSTDAFNDALFMASLNLNHQYGDEYMDENPLKGEPGAFVFTNTKNAVDERNKAHEAQLNAPKLDTQTTSVAPSVAPTPAPVQAESRKGSVAPEKDKKKKERRKSKGVASPTTPGPGVPPAI